MSCTSIPVRFRLLDANIGWDPFSMIRKDGEALQEISEEDVFLGLDDPHGLRLNNRSEPQIRSEILSPYMPPAWLASGCRPCEWLLSGDHCSVIQPKGILLHRDPCRSGWTDLQSRLADGRSLHHPVAIAIARRRVAVVNQDIDGHYRILIWSIPDGRLAGSADIQAGDTPHAIVLTSWRELLVSVEREGSVNQWLLRYDWVGRPRGEFIVAGEDSEGQHRNAKLPLRRLRTAKDGTLWAAEGHDLGPFHLWRLSPSAETAARSCGQRVDFDIAPITNSDFYHQAENRLDAGMTRTRLISLGPDHFCLDESTTAGRETRRCYGRDGQPLESSPPSKTPPSASAPNGVLETQAIDSFIPRCQWHRIRIDADVPANTSYEIQVATSEFCYLNDKDGNPDESALFRPHQWDWQPPERNASDLLIDQPPGRYLFVRIKLTGTQEATPALRRVRIDFPRVTSLDQLPAVYRDDAEAEDFTERFLSLFDAATEDLDQAIERFPAMLDPDGVPEEVLAWQAALLGIVFDSDWNPQLRRKLIAAAPELYRKRGTVAGLQQAIELIFGLQAGQVVIDEHALHRVWGVVNENSRLGAFRLFGKSQSRFRVGRSSLGTAPLRSFGNPDHDPVRVDAHRFTVFVPPCSALNDLGVERLNQLIEHQKPAHTQHQLRIGGEGFILGHRSVIGIDSQLLSPPPVVLRQPVDQSQAARLGAVVLHPGPNRPTSPMHIGVTSAIGVHTQLE
ncbi:phage tail protein [Stieleria varia]|uniref:Phage tail protein n=1 Tax=Stieleria varia TaxID=2528005 RepID=A0A5C5ZXN5_9BACT|nr:phage tail protein [Stieleria varia]TWT91747.1 Phage tail protein [Stieleria varia]